MNRRGTGAVFCFIGAFLLASRYIAAAILGSNGRGVNDIIYGNMLEYIGTPLKTLGILSIIIGFSYLFWAEISDDK